MYIPCTYMSVTYFLFTYMYVKVCTADVQCTGDYVQFIKCTDTVERCMYSDVSFYLQIFYLPCWLACMQGQQGLAAARCHPYFQAH